MVAKKAAKKVKTNSGGVINRREAKTNRSYAGLKDERVSIIVCRKSSS